MIVVRLKGGLGNQMFQYAIGRSLSILQNTQLFLDVTELNEKSLEHTNRKYELNIFNIKAIITSEGFIIYQKKNIGILAKFLNLFCKIKRVKQINEERFHYDSSLILTSDNLYLNGYWNSPRYFEKYEDIIRKDFTFNFNLDNKNIVIAEKIKSSCSVSIHIRRGDYITNSITNAYHGTCDKEYYDKAVNILLEKNKNALFFIFTDDPLWVNDNFKIDAEFIVVSSADDLNSFQDIYLMTMCKHAIIANSTYSWWAAWLITNMDKIVIAPLKWYNDNSIDTKDMFPNSWIRI